MKISYLICTHNETDTLVRLLERVSNNKVENDEIIILDDFSDNQKTKEILESICCCVLNTKMYRHELKNNYGFHKNFGTEKCSGDWVVQLDGDEIPSETLIFNIREIIDTNKYVELIFVPRINDYRGVTENDAKHWGWRLTPSTSIVHEKIIDTESNEYKFLKNNGYILEESKIE
jgi:glycosyltransferase involved in cell wall biosynthesis